MDPEKNAKFCYQLKQQILSIIQFDNIAFTHSRAKNFHTSDVRKS